MSPKITLAFSTCGMVLMMATLPCCERTKHAEVSRTALSHDAASPSSTDIVAKAPRADFGLPVYPGAVADAASVQRVDMGGYYQLHSSFDSAASPEKVVAFYRTKLTAIAPSPDALVETSTSGKTTFILKRDASSVSFVAIEPSEDSTGSEIHLSATGTK